MSRPDHDESVEHEPQGKARRARPDPPEPVADRVVEQSSGPGPAEDLDAHSVFDEPDIFPGREPETITRDWSCTNCGYNLRGLPTGHRCPECGHVALYRPPPPSEASFSAWYRRRQAAVSPRRSWGVVILASLLAAPVATLSAVFMSVPNPLASLILAPAMEEVIKVLAIMLLVDAKPFLVKRSAQIRAAAVISALSYAAVHNAASFAWFISSPSLALILGRWIGGPALHVVCTAIAVTGIIAVWQKADHEARMPRMAEAIPPLTVAIILHAGFNALLFFWGAGSYTF